MLTNILYPLQTNSWPCPWLRRSILS